MCAHGNRQGGSTITMQLARLLWPLNTRTPLGKLEQVARAVQLELFYSKHEILEAYLNDAPYGRNVEGAGAASLVYFDKPVGAAHAARSPDARGDPAGPRAPVARQRRRSSMNKRLTASRDRLYRALAQRAIRAMPR